MRNVATIVLGLFLTSSLLGALAAHCVPGLDERAGSTSAAATMHETGDPHHHDSMPEKGDCAVADVQAPTSLPSAAPAPAPSAKLVAVLWTRATIGTLIEPPEGGRLHPGFSGSARASPPYAAYFARTGRLLI